MPIVCTVVVSHGELTPCAASVMCMGSHRCLEENYCISIDTLSSMEVLRHVLRCAVLCLCHAQALRCALDLEPRLMGPIRAAVAGSCRYACTARLFGEYSLLQKLRPKSGSNNQ